MTSPSHGAPHASSNARAMRADALPAPRTIVRPRGRSGSSESNLPSGRAASNAASNSRLSTCSASSLPISSAASIAPASLTPRGAPPLFRRSGAPLQRSGDLMIGLSLERPDQRRVIPAAAAMGSAGAEQLLAQGCGRQGNVELAGGIEGVVEVLLVQLDPEAGIEGALDHALAMHFENARGGEPAHQRLAHPGRIGSGLRGKNQRLGHRFDGEADHDLVGDLCRLAVTHLADT